MFLRNALLLIAVFSAITSCGVNSVSKAEIEGVKPGSKITYRYKKGDKSWFYADKVTRIEGDTVFYNASRSESTSGKDARIDDYDTSRELSVKMADLARFESEQGPEEKKIIWIE